MSKCFVARMIASLGLLFEVALLERILALFNICYAIISITAECSGLVIRES